MSALDGPEAGGNVAKRAVNQIMSLSKSLDYSCSENVRVYIWYNGPFARPSHMVQNYIYW